MSGQIKLKAASLGGDITLSPTDTASNLVVTIPAAAGELDRLNRAGNVLQVVSATKTDTFSTTSSTYADITGLSVAIVPTSTASKILVIYSVMTGETGSQFPMLRLVRDATAIAVGNAAGSRTQASSVAWGSGAVNASNMQSMNFLDSPSTTSSTTYKIQTIATQSESVFINRNARDADFNYEPRTVSSITVMEIAG